MLKIKNKFFVLANLLISYQISVKAEGPELEKCSLEDSECLITQARVALPSFINGIPELGIEKLNKIKSNDIHVQINDISFHTTDMEVEGLENVMIDKIRINTKVKLIELFFHTNFKFTSGYRVNGSLFSVPVFGNGKGEVNKKNVLFNVITWFDIVKKDNGKSYMNIKAYRYGFEIRDGTHYEYSNMFNGDEIKSKLFHEFLNENWLIISVDFGRAYFDPIVDKIIDTVKKYMAANSLEDIALY